MGMTTEIHSELEPIFLKYGFERVAQDYPVLYRSKVQDNKLDITTEKGFPMNLYNGMDTHVWWEIELETYGWIYTISKRWDNECYMILFYGDIDSEEEFKMLSKMILLNQVMYC